MTRLVVSGVSHRYGRTAALSDVDLDIGPGVTALLGVNGAGKSTLVSVCAGVVAPSAGAVRIGDAATTGRSRRQALRRVALMPQAHDVPRQPHGSGRGDLPGLAQGCRPRPGEGACRRVADRRRARGARGPAVQRAVRRHAAPGRAGSGAGLRRRGAAARRTEHRARPAPAARHGRACCAG
nr:ATP-binding cassette domain-containing protein [Angustibacter aerolatus]